jgi:hypothetical protein
MEGMRLLRSLSGLALAAIPLLTGCAGEAHDATSKELSALTAEISKLRAEQASLADRLDALERTKSRAPEPERADAPRDSAPAPLAVVEARPLDADRPALDVVHLGPSDVDEDNDTDADVPRTVLRSGANGIVVEEQNANGTTRSVTADPAPAKKPQAAPKKGDKLDRKKTASLPTP